MTFTNHLEGVNKLLYTKDYNEKVLLSFNDIISSYTIGVNFAAKQEIAKSILLILNIDYRNHPQFIQPDRFVQKKTIYEHLSSLGLAITSIESDWKEFLEVVEMEAIIYKKTMPTIS